MKLPRELKSEWLAYLKRSQLGIWLFCVAATALIALAWDAHDSRSSKVGSGEPEPETAATYIPVGYVLVPIEVSNFESLDSILGKFGVVDLYEPTTDRNKPATKVASRVRILRAPLNPSHFAVLASEAESPSLVRHAGPFLVVVQNPNSTASQAGTNIENIQKNENGEPVENENRSANHERAKFSRPMHRSSRIRVESNDVVSNN